MDPMYVKVNLIAERLKKSNIALSILRAESHPLAESEFEDAYFYRVEMQHPDRVSSADVFLAMNTDFDEAVRTEEMDYKQGVREACALGIAEVFVVAYDVDGALEMNYSSDESREHAQKVAQGMAESLRSALDEDLFGVAEKISCTDNPWELFLIERMLYDDSE